MHTLLIITTVIIIAGGEIKYLHIVFACNSFIRLLYICHSQTKDMVIFDHTISLDVKSTNLISVNGKYLNILVQNVSRTPSSYTDTIPMEFI